MDPIVVATAAGLFDATTREAIALQDRSVDALSSDGAWAIVDDRELWTRDGGWAHVATSESFDLTCVAGVDDGALVGTAEAHLFRYREGRLATVEPFDEVAGRDDWFTPWGGPPDVRSIAADGDIYVNVHVGGIVKGDGASEWQPTLDISADVHEVKTAGTLLVAACAVGLAESGDGGYAWSFDAEGLHATYARAIAVGDDFLFMSVSQGPRGGDAAIYRQPCDGDRAFERCDLPSFRHNIDTGCLDASGELVAFGTLEGDVYASTDQGSSWERIADGLPAIHHLVIERSA